MSDTPPLFERMIDEAGLDALVADLQGAAQVLEVRAKSRAHAMSVVVGAAGLGAAVAQLRAGDARAVQVLYAFGGAQWSDTIVRVDATRYRVVRLGAPGH